MVGTGSAPYATTKHAVVALSENLYLTLQQRKSLIKVSVLCPGLVRTDIANAERHRPEQLRNDEIHQRLALEPAGPMVVTAAGDGQ